MLKIIYIHSDINLSVFFRRSGKKYIVLQDLPELQWYSAKYCMIVPDAVVFWEKEIDFDPPVIVPRMNEVAVPIPAMFAL